MQLTSKLESFTVLGYVTTHFFRSSAGWILATLCCTGCSLAINPDRTQCSSDKDCAARGAQFLNSVCVQSMCMADTSTDASMPGMGGSGSTSDAGNGGSVGKDAMTKHDAGPPPGTDW